MSLGRCPRRHPVGAERRRRPDPKYAHHLGADDVVSGNPLRQRAARPLRGVATPNRNKSQAAPWRLLRAARVAARVHPHPLCPGPGRKMPFPPYPHAPVVAAAHRRVLPLLPLRESQRGPSESERRGDAFGRSSNWGCDPPLCQRGRSLGVPTKSFAARGLFFHGKQSPRKARPRSRLNLRGTGQPRKAQG